MIPYNNRKLIERLTFEYNTEEYVDKNTIFFPSLYTKPMDIEVSALITSYLSYGPNMDRMHRAAIINKMFDGKPFEWLINKEHQRLLYDDYGKSRHNWKVPVE